MKAYFPILNWLPRYKRTYLSGDISAGLTVGIMLIPQGMAYAMIAGLPPVYGLYAALIPQIIYAIMGTSRQIAIGPVAMDSLLIASGLGALSISGIENYIAMAIFLSLFIGSIQILLGFLKMGFLVNFLSRPVISGFTSAAALIIGVSQLKHLLGISISSNKTLPILKQTFAQLDQINPLAVIVGLSGIGLMLLLKRIHSQIPTAIVVVILGISLAYFTPITDYGLQLVGKIPEGLPGFQIPEIPWSQMGQLFTLALAMALIAFMEVVSIGKALEEKVKTSTMVPNQELIALGTGNIVGSLFQCYPTTAGFSRTAVNFQAGAKTGVAALISAALVGLTLLFLTPVFYYLPNAILASIIMLAITSLIDLKYPKELYKNQKDEFILLIVTFLITLFVGIQEGIILGVLFSLLLMVYRTSKPHMAVLGQIKDTTYFKNVNRFATDIIERKDILVVRFDAQLFFGNKDYFYTELNKHIMSKGPQLKTVIVNAEAINYVDSSAIYILKHLILELREKEIQLMIAAATGPTRDILFKTGVTELLGPENLFVRVVEAVEFIDGIHPRTEIEDRVSRQSF
ncbi:MULTISPECIES: SulP family inorganic anion transporter [unclassified Leeuwenhoekiella]|uniref:SulP family inorganic anion transporter n=1 Tax=unclassified Leeuwenhoekiella TaxID=2615029 RepID=UPI000C54169D|nr:MULTISPECIES: solute carrier family 26 protein [unclassified Leeuwenhoekiella]MAW94540.1 sodium-independent anion transporter [Leeuwenhoekiella sp.]MBA81963.1 sodium-independent anion transporter [Leeuwenhoekiella sp.]